MVIVKKKPSRIPKGYEYVKAYPGSSKKGKRFTVSAKLRKVRPRGKQVIKGKKIRIMYVPYRDENGRFRRAKKVIAV